jgi:hypothetical protein
MPRAGKIDSFPVAIREEVHRRLLDGETGSQILPWLNAHPKVRAILDRSFQGVDVSDENLSSFRNGPHQEWLRRREKAESLKSLAEYAAKLAGAAGQNMSAGAQAIATGRIMEVLEAGAYEETDLPKLIHALTALRNTDLQQSKLDLSSRSLDLSISKFHVQTCELFLKWYEDEEAKRVASGKEDRTVKVEKLRQLMFGENPYAGE